MARHAPPPLAEAADYPLPPDVLPGTLGRHVVELAERVEWHESLGDDPYAKKFAGTWHEEAIEEAKAVRQELDILPEHKKRELSFYVQSVLHDVVPKEYAGDPGLIDRLADASDRRLIEFLRRHVYNLEQQQHDMAGFIEQQKEDYIVALEDAAKQEGWVSPHALTRQESIADTQVVIGDYWSLQLNDYGGYYFRGSPFVIVAQGLGNTPEMRNDYFVRKVPPVLWHELYHKEFGENLPDEDEWLDEAMATHVTLGLRYGQPEILDPAARNNDRNEYRGYRELAAAMMGDNEAALLTRACTSEGLESQEWQQLRQRLSRYWGTDDVVGKISARVGLHTQRFKEEAGDIHRARAGELAARKVKKELLHNPERIFGKGYKKPQPHMGAAALSGASK